MRAMLAVLFCALSFFACVSLAHPLSDEESLELFKRYFDPIRFAMGPIRTKEDLDKRESVIASKRYFDPILFKHAF
ncbi:unnamed protein product [Hydatigera taeniaeformis]|uniref:Uncharacterized protein n=1 Tax=Hydatigena taeniaeformis TaxID=6205 RepID=A0A0R3WI57_HYDTA|nr:unnamed protein product [Hydatigera taeniaeformis]